MTDHQDILRQVELSKKAIAEMKRQTFIFDQVLSNAVKSVPEEHKKVIHDVQVLSQRAMALAKEGKSEEAQQLIKDFQNGKNFK